MWTSWCAPLLALVAAATVSGAPQDSGYAAVVAQFADSPNAAIEKMQAMPPDDVERAVGEACRAGSGWSTESLDRALLMHGDAAIALTAEHRDGAARHVALAARLAMAAATRAGNEWFVHRWYKAFTARVPAKPLEAQWHQQPWFEAASSIDRARELEMAGGLLPMPVDTTSYDPAPFRQAIPLLKRAISDHFLVAAIHLGRIQMLRGEDAEARRLMATATRDPASRVNRYLSNLLLGSLNERDNEREGAEFYYRAAAAALPRAQSGRIALAAFLERTGRAEDARRVIAVSEPSPAYDPWWSYFRGTSRDHAIILAELHVEVGR